MQGVRTIDSREIAARFARRHHNILAAIDQVLRLCPAAAAHIRFEKHPVTAGLGGTRYVRHAILDQMGFMQLAMSLPSTQREQALSVALTLADRA